MKNNFVKKKGGKVRLEWPKNGVKRPFVMVHTAWLPNAPSRATGSA